MSRCRAYPAVGFPRERLSRVSSLERFAGKIFYWQKELSSLPFFLLSYADFPVKQWNLILGQNKMRNYILPHFSAIFLSLN